MGRVWLALTGALCLVSAWAVWFSAKLSDPSPGSWKAMGALGMVLFVVGVAALALAAHMHRDNA